jgi:hypothetical protein
MIKINNKEFPYSFSQNRLYEDCPKKYFFRYHEGIQEPSNENLELGSAIHKLLELKWWNVDEDNCYDIPDDDFADAVKAEKLIKEHKGTLYLSQLMDELREFFKDKQIHYSECEVFIDDCICKIDIIYTDINKPGKIILGDFKVTKNPKGAEEAISEGQLLLYKMAFFESFAHKVLDVNDEISFDDILVQYINILPYASFKIVLPSILMEMSAQTCSTFLKCMASNKEKINNLETMIDESHLIANAYLIIKRGKKNYYIGKYIIK